MIGHWLVVVYLESKVIVLAVTSSAIYFLEYSLVKEKSGCENGGDIPEGKLSIEDCFKTCRNKASMFVIGRRGTLHCDGMKCLCYCTINAFRNGTCVFRPLPRFDLHKINAGEGKFRSKYVADAQVY